MTRAHFVKKARKAHPEGGIKKGESYWWWAFMVGGHGGPKHYSKTQPRRSQLTQSDYLGQLYDIEDDIAALTADESLGDSVSDIASRLNDLADEQESKLENMPDGLKEGDTGQMLQERADACRQAAEEFEGLDLEPTADVGTGDEETDKTFWQEKLDEVQAVSIES